MNWRSNALRGGFVGVFLCLGSMSLPGQPPKSDQAKERLEIFMRFAAVKKWEGNFTLKFDADGTNGERHHRDGSVKWFATGTFTLDQKDEPSNFQPPQPVTWRGDGTANGRVDNNTVFTSYWGLTDKVGQVSRDTSTAWGGGRLFSSQEELPKYAGSGFGPQLRIVHHSSANQAPMYQFSSGTVPLEARTVRSSTNFDFFTGKVDGTSGPKITTGKVWLYAAVRDEKREQLKLPAEGLRLRGKAEIPVHSSGSDLLNYHRAPLEVVGPFHVWPGNRPSPPGTLEWDLWPAVDDVEVVVDPLGYDTWLPEAGPDEKTPGNKMTIRAMLQKKGGGEAPRKAKKFTFKLVGVSREPGICINYPPKERATTDPDLQFHEKPDRSTLSDWKQAALVTSEGLQAETPDGQELTQAYATLAAHDWGAFGVLCVTAEMADGGAPVMGYLKDHPEQKQILLPKRQPNSFIADKWKADHNVPAGWADKDDRDSQPFGDGVEGDGLTLYEEYRGFYAKGTHYQGDPHKKDFFVRDETGRTYVGDGITRFRDVTGLEVNRLDGDELNPDRVVNFNHKTAHRDDRPDIPGQRGIRIVLGDPETGGAAARNENPQGFLAWLFPEPDAPGTPKKIKQIEIGGSTLQTLRNYPFRTDSNAIDEAAVNDYAVSMVAHELCHCVNVWHHSSERDITETWTRGKDQNGNTVILAQQPGKDVAITRNFGFVKKPAPPKRITLWTADGHTQYAPLDPDLEKWGYIDQPVYVGRLHGEHSGDRDCLMTYNCAGASIADEVGSLTPEQLKYRMLDPTSGMRNIADLRATIPKRLCNTFDGGGNPYGDADRDPPRGPKPRGNCKGQIRVNDYDDTLPRGR